MENNMSKDTYKIGVDVGGTKMKAVLLSHHKVIEEGELATPQDNTDHFLNMLKALLDPLLEKADTDKKKIEGIGLSIAGMHDLRNGKIVYSPNITYLNNLEVVKEVEKRWGYSAKLDNDANCFLRAEAKMGAGEKFNNLFGITIGTGIGGAWWLNNKIYRGSHGSAGEVGHTIIHFENTSSLEEWYQSLSDQQLSVVAEQAYRGEEESEETFKKLGEYLGYTCANAVNLIDPEAVIIGGGAAESEELFFPYTKKVMQSYIASPLSKKTKLLKAKLDDPAALGAALLFE